MTIIILAAVAILAIAAAGFALGDRRHCTHRHGEGVDCNPRCQHGTHCPAGVTR